MQKIQKVKLLIMTQKIDVNDPILGFFVRWVEEFAKHFEFVTVICLQKGEHNLPSNTKVLSLGKEDGVSRLKYIFRFYKYILQENYDVVFVHMNQVYILLGGLIWRLLSKKIGLWYAHGHTPFSLHIAEKLSHIIFTSTKSGFRLKSGKLRIIGQGIDTKKFKPAMRSSDDTFKIVSVGRISPVKDYETIINAVEVLVQKGMNLNVEIIGSAGLPEQESYLSVLKNMVKEKSLGRFINFKGAVPNTEIIPFLQKSDLFVNTSHTGSLDKAMLEAMAVGIPTVSCNEAMLEIFGDYSDKLMYNKKDFNALADGIEFIINLSAEERNKMSSDLRNIVVRRHNISRFIDKISGLYE